MQCKEISKINSGKYKVAKFLDIRVVSSVCSSLFVCVFMGVCASARVCVSVDVCTWLCYVRVFYCTYLYAYKYAWLQNWVTYSMEKLKQSAL